MRCSPLLALTFASLTIVLSAGCGSSEPPPKTADEIEASRVEHKTRADRERSESQ